MRFFWFLVILNFLACDSCLKKDYIRLGVMAGPESKIMEKAAIIAKEKYGLNVKIIEFSDYMTPNIALNDGSIDANAFQHEPFLRAFVKARSYDIIPVAKTFIFPMAAYSHKIKDKKELKNEDKITIPNDQSNGARALLLLARENLLKLKDINKTDIGIKDIIENPLNLKIIELDAAQLPRSLDDVTLAVINNTFAKSSGLSLAKDALFREDEDSIYVNVLAVRVKNQEAPWLEKLIKAIHSDEVLKVAKETLGDEMIKGFK